MLSEACGRGYFPGTPNGLDVSAHEDMVFSGFYRQQRPLPTPNP